MKRYAVLGWPIGHSKSPAMMNAAFEAAGIVAEMTPIGVPPERLVEIVTAELAAGLAGASVTVPHKIAIKALCDELSPAARAISAVNCLAREGTSVVGHNTDCDGFADAAAAAGLPLAGKRVVILGAGGAARAVAYGARDATIEVIARRPSEVEWTHALAWTPPQLRASFSRADVVVDCTPAGLDLTTDAELTAMLPLDALPRSSWVATLIYHRETSLLERARASGHSTLDGKGMLVHQGARAFTIWTGRPAPVDVMTRALADALVKSA